MKAITFGTVRRCVVLLVLCLAGACQVWKVEPGPVPAALAAGPLPNEIRLTTTDRRMIILQVPRVAGDSVFGARHGGAVNAVSIDAITRVERRRIDGGRTAVAVLGLAGLAVGTVVLLQGLSELDECGIAGCP